MKIVMIVNNTLPKGLAANTTAVLGITLGHLNRQILGPDIPDASASVHKGITTESIPVLGADDATLKEIYTRSLDHPAINLIDFNRIAQSCRDYTEYAKELSKTRTGDLCFSGLCLSGPKRTVNSLTGELPLFR